MVDTERRPMSLWMLILVVFGLYTIPRGLSTGPAPASSKSEGKDEGMGTPSSSDDGVDSDESGSIGRLLFEHFLPGHHDPEIPLPKILGKDAAYLRPLPEVRCLIATLADPIRSTSGYHFDEGITAIQRGVESQKYVLDRYWFPWLEEDQQQGVL
jgi:hypothetical protein